MIKNPQYLRFSRNEEFHAWCISEEQKEEECIERNGYG